MNCRHSESSFVPGSTLCCIQGNQCKIRNGEKQFIKAFILFPLHLLGCLLGASLPQSCSLEWQMQSGSILAKAEYNCEGFFFSFFSLGNQFSKDTFAAASNNCFVTLVCCQKMKKSSSSVCRKLLNQGKWLHPLGPTCREALWVIQPVRKKPSPINYFLLVWKCIECKTTLAAFDL